MGIRDELEADIQTLAVGLKAADSAGETERASKLAGAFKRAKRRLDLIASNPGEYDPDSDEFKAKYGATSGMSGFDKFRSGVGKAFSDIGHGAQQRASDLASLLPVSPASAGLVAARKGLMAETQATRERDRPLISTGAGMAGNIAGNIAAFAPLGGAVTSIPRAIGLGAAEGAFMPTAKESELGVNTLVGGAAGGAGQLVASGVQRAFRPVQRSLSARGNDAVDLLRREGVDLDVAQRTGSGAAQRLRSSFGDNPLTVSRQQDFLDTQKRQFTRAVLRRIGAHSDEATPDVLERATRQIGDEIDDALRSAPPIWDDVLDAQMREIQEAIPGSMTEADARPLLLNIDDLMNSAIASGDNVIEPAVFTKIRANLSNLRAKGNPLASDVEDIMLEALERSGGNRAGLSSALARWRNWKIIENSIDKGFDKTISPKRLANTLATKRQRTASLRHLGHPETIALSRLADAGVGVLPETLGNSGTAARAIAAEAALGAGGFGGALLTGQDVGDAAAIGMGAAALPLLLQRGMLSQGALGNYLTEGGPAVLQGLTQSPLTQSLLRQGVISGGLLGE